ncbi:MAG: AMP-binding protein, partial [Oligoflexus sp.]
MAAHDKRKGLASLLMQGLIPSQSINEILERNKPLLRSVLRVATGREAQQVNRLKGEVKSLRSEVEQLKTLLKDFAVQEPRPFEPKDRNLEHFPQQPWERFYDAEVLKHYAPPKNTIVDNFRETVRKFPSKDFTLFQGASIDYKTADRYTDAIAAALQLRGVQKGDRVAIQLPNIPQVVLAYYGVMKAGGIVVFVSPLYTEEEIVHQLNDAQPKVFITLDIIYDKRVRKVREQLSSVRDFLLCDIKAYLPAHLRTLYPIKAKKTGMLAQIRKDDDVEYLDRLIEDTSRDDYTPVSVDFDDIAVLQYTGGTTGRSKGAILTHGNLAANVAQLHALQYSAQVGEESILTAVPIFHVLGMTVCLNLGVKLGACLILVPKFDIELIVKAITRYQPTFFPGVPTMFVAFNNYPGISELDVSSIKSCFSGSAPLPEDVMRRFEQLTGSKIVEGYGLSEASPVTHVNPLYGKRKLNSIGIPIPGTEAKVVNMETGEPCPPNTPGELLVKGPQVMRGYWN